MKNILAALLVVSVLYTVSKEATAISCYVCTGCAEPFVTNTSALTNCTTGLDQCMKTTIRYPGGAFITKMCTQSSACKEMNYNLAGYGFWLNCCTADGCNSSSKIYARLESMIALLLLLAIKQVVSF